MTTNNINLAMPSSDIESNKYSCRTCLEEIDHESEDCLRPCNCIDGYQHQECLVRWIQTSKTDECSVCKEKYNIVKYNNKPTKKIPWCPIISSLLFEILIWTPVFFDDDYIDKLGWFIGLVCISVPWMIFGHYYEQNGNEETSNNNNVQIIVVKPKK